MLENVTLTDATLAEIEARAKAATPGPWYHMQAGDVVPLKMRPPATYDWLSDHPQAGLHKKIIIQRGACYGGTDDYAFIAHARADVPALIAALRASRERVALLETAGRMWIQALDMMRSLSVHDPMQEGSCELDGQGREADARRARRGGNVMPDTQPSREAARKENEAAYFVERPDTQPTAAAMEAAQRYEGRLPSYPVPPYLP